MHALESAGALVGAPVARAGDEHRRHVDGAAGEQLQFGFVEPGGARAIPVEPALKPVARVFGGIDRKLALRQPAAGRDLCRRRHYRRHGLGHVPVEIHDVVGRHLGQFAGAPRLQRVRPVAGPVGALVMEIAAQEGVDALRAMPHLGIGRPGRIIPLVMLARPVEPGQRRVDVVARRGIRRRRVGGVEGQRRRPGEGRAHQRQRAEHVGPHQRAPGGDRRRRNRGRRPPRP